MVNVLYKLSKHHILKKNRQFQAVYRWGKSIANKYLVMYVLKQSKKSTLPHQIGFAAGKRLGCAVVRNRIKRLLRESFRLNQYKFPDGYFVIFVARKPLIAADFSTVSIAMNDLLKRAMFK